ncbi:response regulator [Sneathiella sp. P13V-1]|uniref:ATP-binding protein n=1 Tax=Sneathiella sp. P13V-1 TaxID=2697366 RepID=UPI00187B8A10|nr:ATP-binding protein [Sneathiella sp. P13V-1]MBE7636229.1 response regulator [Sneathiella sp. P13V-1]
MATNNSTFPKNVLIYTPVLIILGLLANHFNVPLFFSVSLIFGSVFSLITLMVFGFAPALVVAIIVSSYTYFLWGHPYAIIIFTMEIVVVGALRQRIPTIAFADLLYWVFCGVPLVFVFYFGVLDLNLNASLLIAMKQAINGVFNAVLASLIVSFFYLIKKDETADVNYQFSGKYIVTSFLMLLTILAGAIPIILNGYRVKSLQEDNLHHNMLDYGTLIAEELQASYQSDEGIQGKFGNVEPGKNNLHFQLAGLAARVSFFNDTPPILLGKSKVSTEKGTRQHLYDNLNIWQPEGEMASMTRWSLSEYYTILPPLPDIGVSEIMVSSPAHPLVDILYKVRAQTMFSLAILVATALAVSHLLGHILISPIQRLAKASKKIKTLEKDDKEITFPRSPILEYDELSQALQNSSDSMRSYINALKEMSANLEDRVKERTEELARLSMVASQTTNGVIITDEKGVLEWANEGMTRITGYTLEDMKGKKPGLLLQGENTSPRTAKRISKAVREKRAFNEEILNYTKDGREIWLQITGNPLTNQDGEVTGFIGIETDITERRLDRLNLIRARIDAERSNEAKSTFLSTMSHEIRTPLNGIMGMAQLLQGTDLDAEQETFTQTIMSSSNALLSIINDILDMSKIEAGALEIEQTPFDLGVLVSTSLTPLRAMASEKDLTLIHHLPDYHPSPQLIGDPVRFRQILTNLVGNAIKFTNEGNVTVRLDLEPDYAPAMFLLKMTVTDTGVGIASDRLEEIFNPFTQEDNTITRKFGGTGLGLSIVSKLVRLMDGTISVTSKVGEGTEFKVEIPMNAAQQVEEVDVPAAAPSNTIVLRPGLKVMVVEDNSVNAIVAQSFLNKTGCEVTLAANGKIAADSFADVKPDLIFMDAHMPVMDGIAATATIRAQKNGRNTKIIGLTADAFEENRQKFLKAGMDDILTKPFKEDQLHTILNKYFPETDEVSITLTEEKSTSDVAAEETPMGDEQELSALGEQIGQEAMSAMLALAPDSFKEQLAEIEEGVAGRDSKRVLEAGHALRGAASALYCYRLSEIAAVFEKNNDELELVTSRLGELRETVAETIDWLSAKVD